jgi:hypothetical protein
VSTSCGARDSAERITAGWSENAFGEICDMAILMTAVPAVRIWPMSDKIPGFRGKSIAQVQADCFGRDLPKAGGAFSYRSAGLQSPPGTVVLFQFQARIIASALLLRDERFKSPRAGRRGRLHLDPASIRTFEPLDFAAMRRIWPGIRPFGHVKQVLNPTLYAKFRRRTKGTRD